MMAVSNQLTTQSGEESPGRLAERFGLPWMETVTDDALDPDLIKDLPLEWARTHCMLPIRLEGEPHVLLADPANVSEQESLSLLTGLELRPVVTTATRVQECIERCYYRQEHSPSEFLRDLSSGEPAGQQPGRADDLLRVATEAPVTQLVNLILLDAVKKNASDIHIEPYVTSLRVRYRIDGTLYEQSSPPKHLEESLVSRLKVMAHMDIAERRLPQDGMARVRVGEREIDIRMSTIPVAEGERVVLRILNVASVLLPLEALGMREQTLQQFRPLLAEPNGIVIVSGPTGSGKTTTLYAALGTLDSARRNILTIEDPVEYQLPNIGQMQVKPKIGLSFASGLRHILRQDPDVVLVGETRDLETAEIAVRASLTGHLVFTTLHTNDAPGTILRLIDMGVPPYLLASSLRGVLAQRLVRRLCPSCAVSAPVSAAVLDRLGPAGADVKGCALPSPQGCASCREGYQGRTGLFEVMVVNEEAQELIRHGNPGLRELRETAERLGMVSMVQDGIVKCRNGQTSMDEVAGVVAQVWGG